MAYGVMAEVPAVIGAHLYTYGICSYGRGSSRDRSTPVKVMAHRVMAHIAMAYVVMAQVPAVILAHL